MPATKDNLLVISGVAQRKRVGLITRRSVDRNHSPLNLKCLYILQEFSSASVKRELSKRCGAEEACRAHNPKVSGSKPLTAK